MSNTDKVAASLRALGDKYQSIRTKLRNVRMVLHKVSHIVAEGCIKDKQALAIQFSKDCHIYGIWEALLYVEGYEGQGFYKYGTAEKAFRTFIPKEKKPKDPQ